MGSERRSLVFALSVGVPLAYGLAVQPIWAQEPLRLGEATPEECRRAEETMREHESGSERYGAIKVLAQSCGAHGGDALSREFLTMRAVTDTVTLNQTVRGLITRRNASILAAATEVASDRSAAFEARVAGLRVVVTQATSKCRVAFQDFAQRQEGMLVATNNMISVHPIGPPDPGFPADWRETIDSLLNRMEQDPTESEAMRWAANRTLVFLRC